MVFVKMRGEDQSLSTPDADAATTPSGRLLCATPRIQDADSDMWLFSYKMQDGGRINCGV
jgi:hypothetical protein